MYLGFRLGQLTYSFFSFLFHFIIFKNLLFFFFLSLFPFFFCFYAFSCFVAHWQSSFERWIITQQVNNSHGRFNFNLGGGGGGGVGNKVYKRDLLYMCVKFQKETAL